MDDYKNLIVEVIGELALIKIMRDKGEKNYLSSVCQREIMNAFVQVQEKFNPKVIVITGGGKVFSLGADLDEISSLTAEKAVEFSKSGQELIKTIKNSNSVTIAAVNGMTLGGGFEIALACDIRWAHSRAVFAFPECKRGLIPAWGGTQLIKSTISPSLAAELVMSGMYLGAESALKAGVVSRIFTGNSFHQDVLSAAEQFVDIDSDIVVKLKYLMNSDLSFGESLIKESLSFSELVSKKISQ